MPDVSFHEIIKLNEEHLERRTKLLNELLGKVGKNLFIEPPFYCDYGYNIRLGNDVFINFNCCILDVTPVFIGNNVMIGPNVQIYTATHPLKAKERSSSFEFGKPISIGDDVWIGGSAIICPGITIGNGLVVQL
jgi:maltose O-acetyltransferase